MKVILLKDVEKIGKQYEVKEVAQGHAMNFLIPKGLAKPANAESLKLLEAQKEALRVKAEEDLAKVQALATSLDGQEVVISIKAGAEKKQLFEAVSTQKVADKLKDAGFEIKKTQITLKEPIKELGEFPVKIRLAHNLEAEIKVIVIEEKK